MRAIKFHAWHKEEKRMYYVGGFHHILEAYYTEPERQFEPDIQKVYLLEDSPRTCQKVWQYPADEVELMEYTGLHDRLGKEIYEGDILKTNRGLFEVFWREDFAGFYLRNVEDPRWLDLISMTGNVAWGEVIGNIYEHPELVQRQ